MPRIFEIHKTAAEFVLENAVLPPQYTGVELGTGLRKPGDGSRPWNSLNYVPTLAGSRTCFPGAAETAGDFFPLWSNTSNALADNDQFATATYNAGFPVPATDALRFSDFDFNIPTDATITELTITLKHSWSGTNSIQAVGIYMVKNGEQVATDASSLGSLSLLPATPTVITYTAPDLWNETWTPADINASDFGAAIYMGLTSPSGLVTASSHVHYVTITVSWT